MTRSQSASLPRWSVARDAAEDGVPVVGGDACSLATCLSRLVGDPATTPSAPGRVRDRTITSNPALAATSASPEPMIPEPTMPTVWMSPMTQA